MVMLSKRLCETMTQFNDNLSTQFNVGKGYQGIRTVITFEFENTKRDVNKYFDH